MTRSVLFTAAVFVVGSLSCVLGCLTSGDVPNAGAIQQEDAVPAAVTLAEVVFPPPAVFDHEFHIDDAELECVECHHETAASPLNTPHVEYFEDLWITCETCHHGDTPDLGPQACEDCHTRAAGGISDQTITAKVATHLSCWECHDSGTGVEASENCVFCHQEPEED